MSGASGSRRASASPPPFTGGRNSSFVSSQWPGFTDILSEKDRPPVSGSSTVWTSFRAHSFGSFGWTGPAGSGAAVVSAAVFFAAVCPPPFPEVPPHAASRTLPASSRESILLFIFLFLSCHYLRFCESTGSVFIIIKNPAGNSVAGFLSMTEWFKGSLHRKHSLRRKQLP